MQPIGIISVVIVIVAVAGALIFAFRALGSLTGAEKERQRLLRIGLPAHARILGLTMGNMTVTTGVHRQLQVHISVEVHRSGAPPYPARITGLISELQIPLVQPGAWLGVRIDPANPENLGIEALRVPPPGAAPQPGMGMPIQMGGTPMTGFQVPLGAKIGIAAAILGAAVGIGGAVMGSIGSLTGPSDTCKKATACCRKVSGSSPACDNYVRVSGPTSEQVCGNALKGYQQAGCK
jgi:hypothetical protein